MRHPYLQLTIYLVLLCTWAVGCALRSEEDLSRTSLKAEQEISVVDTSKKERVQKPPEEMKDLIVS